MRKTIPSVLLAISLASSVAVAQNPGRRQFNPANRIQHQVKFLTTVLGLNAGQQQQATAIFTTEDSTLSGQRNGEQAARKSLAQAIASNDTAGIGTASATIGNLTAAATAARATAEAAFEQTLTPAQLAIWQQLKHTRGGGGFRSGPPPRPGTLV